MTTTPQQACTFLLEQKRDFKPSIGMILGSGLDKVAEMITDVTHIPYTKIPGFPQPQVLGHAGTLSLGWIQDLPIACLRGRSHYYEGDAGPHVKQMIRTLKLLGCQQLIITNAAGSLCLEYAPGELVLINDHINLQAKNPLTGINDEEFGPRFPDMTCAYHPELLARFKHCAIESNAILHEGIYLAVDGPQFETPAEICAFRTMGADIVGMSTAAEALVANHCGLQVAALSMITNYATGLTQQTHDHTQVVATAKNASQQLVILLEHYLRTTRMSSAIASSDNLNE